MSRSCASCMNGWISDVTCSSDAPGTAIRPVWGVAALGGGLFKQRIARPGEGRSGGFGRLRDIIRKRRQHSLDLAVIELKHHRLPTAEGPSIENAVLAFHGINCSEGFAKKIFPAGGRRRHARRAGF
ncbi:MAG: hypothetical protein F4213_22340 [Boseongicola sp. SB0677_bin_26]|nr:hypothetical protein [Boseongicola sp. SB0665_bin_10]MYG28719.1 hypothetical protein [Boseongicola sp. SB0677_bin_26]